MGFICIAFRCVCMPRRKNPGPDAVLFPMCQCSDMEGVPRGVCRAHGGCVGHMACVSSTRRHVLRAFAPASPSLPFALPLTARYPRQISGSGTGLTRKAMAGRCLPPTAFPTVGSALAHGSSATFGFEVHSLKRCRALRPGRARDGARQDGGVEEDGVAGAGAANCV